MNRRQFLKGLGYGVAGILMAGGVPLLQGCGGAKPQPASSAAGSGSSGASRQKVTLKFMGWEASPLETESVKRGLDLFMQRNPNIRVEYTPVPGSQYSSKLLAMLAGNAAPDVFFLASTDYRAFQQRGVLLDLTPQFDAEFKREDFIPSAAQIMTIDGKIFGVSSCTVSPVLYYNKKFLTKQRSHIRRAIRPRLGLGSSSLMLPKDLRKKTRRGRLFSMAFTV